MVSMFNPPPAKKITERAAKDAAETLGIVTIRGVTLDAVKSAYRARLRLVHPDKVGAKENAADGITSFQRARETLEKWLAENPVETCSVCRGSGTVPAGNPFQKVKPCPLCQ